MQFFVLSWQGFQMTVVVPFLNYGDFQLGENDCIMKNMILENFVLLYQFS